MTNKYDTKGGPVITTAIELAAQQAGVVLVDLVAEVWTELESCPLWSLEEFQQRLCRIGRVSGPALLSDAYAESAINKTTVKAVIGDVWSMAEYPDASIGHGTWRWLFGVAGYTVDGEPAERQTEPIRLYRGSIPERRADWSWTDNRDVAERYASGTHYHRPVGAVWTAVVDPERLLARNTGRKEDEYVVDTNGLEIQEVISER